MPLIVRWPGQVKENAVSNQLVCLTDFLATFAAVIETELPEGAGPDSFSFLSAMTCQPAVGNSIRNQFVMQAGSLPSMKTIRSGDWKLITQLGSGGFSKPKYIEPEAEGPTGQLYNLAEDAGERNNLFLQHPDVVKRLTAELDEIVDGGSSRNSAAKPSNVSVDRSTLIGNRSTLIGKVMCGYQGWFNCEGDGSRMGWKHWAKDRRRLFAT